MSLPEPRPGESLEFHIYPETASESTLGNAEAIVWSSILHLCSQAAAEWVARITHNIRSKRDRTAVRSNLRLYIQQAYQFYEAAGAAKPNTAPLIYYYSFLNLAKALCELRKPRLHTRDECYSHGLSWRPDRRSVVNLARERVTITAKPGMWHALWEALMGSRCPVGHSIKLPIKHLFSCCPEITSEFGRVFGYRHLGFVDLEKPDILRD
jgi:hypothetical protein